LQPLSSKGELALNQAVVNRRRMMTAFTLSNPNVPRLEPLLNIKQEHLGYFAASLDETLHKLGSFTRMVLRFSLLLLLACFTWFWDATLAQR
jgi:hypothetical protein